MGYKVSFMDNQVCGVDDFNAILGDIVQEGVVTADFDKTSTYQMSKMNVVTKGKVSQGVSAVETSLACSVGMKDGENGVYVAPGLGVFGSGARVKVTESEFVSIGDNTDVYIYAYHDMKNNLAGFLCTGDGFPTEVADELYILQLCQIVDGVFTDKREYAKAKLNVCETFNTTKKMTLTTPGADYHKKEIELPVGGTGINFLVFACHHGNCDTYIVEEPEYGVFTIKKYATREVSSVSISDNIGFSDFRRGDNGELLVMHKHYGGSVQTYDLYASVYEEVSG